MPNLQSAFYLELSDCPDHASNESQCCLRVSNSVHMEVVLALLLAFSIAPAADLHLFLIFSKTEYALEGALESIKFILEHIKVEDSIMPTSMATFLGIGLGAKWLKRNQSALMNYNVWGVRLVHLPRFWPLGYGGTGRTRDRAYHHPDQGFPDEFTTQSVSLLPPRERREKVFNLRCEFPRKTLDRRVLHPIPQPAGTAVTARPKPG